LLIFIRFNSNLGNCYFNNIKEKWPAVYKSSNPNKRPTRRRRTPSRLTITKSQPRLAYCTSVLFARYKINDFIQVTFFVIFLKILNSRLNCPIRRPTSSTLRISTRRPRCHRRSRTSLSKYIPVTVFFFCRILFAYIREKLNI
jgi:hypothetical protein